MFYYFLWLCSQARAMASSFTRFLDHTQRRATVGRTPLDERLALRKTIYPTTETQQTNIHAPCEIRTHDRSRRPAVDLRLGPRGHWNRPLHIFHDTELFITVFITAQSLFNLQRRPVLHDKFFFNIILSYTPGSSKRCLLLIYFLTNACKDFLYVYSPCLLQSPPSSLHLICSL
jgi:hypothetical protein